MHLQPTLLSATGACCLVSCSCSFVCHKPKTLTTSRAHTRILASSNIIAEANVLVEVVIISFYENSQL